MTTFAEEYVSYPDGQQNVDVPPAAILSRGFIPATSTARGQPLTAQYLNWLFQRLFRLANRDVVTTSAGVGLFTQPNSAIRLEAFDRDDPNKFLVAIGYKSLLSIPHSLKVVASSGLALGTATAGGNQPVTGGTDVVIVGYSRQ